MGILQIDVFQPRNRDIAIALDIAGKVAEWFPADLKMIYGDVTVRVTAAPSIAQPMDDDVHVMVPVTVLYESFC